MKTLSIGLLAVALLVGCANAKEKIDEASGGSEEKTYSITGIIFELNRENNNITILHDDVTAQLPISIQTQGVVQGKQKAYELRGERVESLSLGKFASVTATLHQRGRQLWVTDVKPRQ